MWSTEGSQETGVPPSSCATSSVLLLVRFQSKVLEVLLLTKEAPEVLTVLAAPHGVWTVQDR